MNNSQMPSNSPHRGAASNNNRPSNNRTPSRQNTNRQPQAPLRPQNKAASAANGRVKNQSPTKRRPEAPKVKLTAEQMEINRANRRREKYYLKKRRSAALRTFLARLVLFLVVFLVLLLVAGGIFYLNLTASGDGSASRYSYAIGDKKYSLSAGDAVRDGRVYVNFNDIAEMCGFAITGSVDDIKFVVKGDEAETIRFVGDSRAVFVNGIETRLASESYVKNEDIYVPLDFVEAYCKGIDIKVSDTVHSVEISRVITNLDDKGKLPKDTEPIYAEPSFLLQSTLGLEPLSEDEELRAEAPDLGFTLNLDFYEDYMNPGNTDEFLILVSRENKLTADYVPQDLCELLDTRDDGRQMQLMRKNAAMALEAMFKELRAAGFIDVSVTSAYRSYSYQESLYKSYVAQHGEDLAKTFSMPAGASEHQSGLCADLHNLPAADKVFANEPAYDWLRTNCWKFGFILRYPEDKMEITAIDFEPWHYRYVGRYHAQRIYEKGMCLEEYLEYIGFDKGSAME